MTGKERKDLFRIPNEDDIPLDQMNEEEIELRELLADFTKDPEDTETLLKITKLLMSKCLYEEAWLYLERYMKQVKDDPEAYNCAGVIHFVRSDFEASESFFEEVLKLDSDHEDALYNCAMLYSERGDFEQARNCLEKLAGLESNNPEVFNNLGTLLYQADDLKGAEEKFKHALELDEENESALRNLMDLYLEQGRTQEGEAHFAMYERTYPDAEDLEELRNGMAAPETAGPAPEQNRKMESRRVQPLPTAAIPREGGLKVGILSDWCPGDRGELAWWLYRSLNENGHMPHVLARTGQVPHCAEQKRRTYPRSMGRWVVPDMTLSVDVPVNPLMFQRWIQHIQPDVVIFVDEACEDFIEMTHKAGAVALACPAMIGGDRNTARALNGFDGVIAASPWIYETLKEGVAESKLIPTDLGVDLENFRPTEPTREETVFLFDGGHGAVEELEDLMTVLNAFSMMQREAMDKSRLLIRTSVDWNLFPEEIRNRGEGHPRIDVVSGHLEDSWFLSMGDVLVHLNASPGVHWMVAEAAACGVPSIILDQSPAAGWIFDHHMMLKVPRALSNEKEDHSFTADAKTLGDVMSTLASDLEMADYMGVVCREKAQLILNHVDRGRGVCEKIVTAMSAHRNTQVLQPVSAGVASQGAGAKEAVEGSDPNRILNAIEEAIAEGRQEEAQALMTQYRRQAME